MMLYICINLHFIHYILYFQNLQLPASKMQRLVETEDLKRLFAVADLNGNGKISVGELLVFLRKLGLVMD